MKKVLLVFVTIFCVVFVQAQYKNFIDQPYIEVNGFADSLVTPNEIYIKIIISEADTKNKISLEELEQKMYESLKKLGIDADKDLKITDMLSNFKNHLLKNKDVLKTKQYSLKVNSALIASKVLIELENLNIANTSIERTEYSDLENLKNILRSKAIGNAKARAIALAKPLNQSIGAAIQISDNENYNFTTQRRNDLNEVVVVGYGGKKIETPALPSIDFEKIKVSANIRATFILKQ